MVFTHKSIVLSLTNGYFTLQTRFIATYGNLESQT